ncbi:MULTISPECIES: S24/S26 family peptidase [unclassified Actinoplanes]|uniref:S24/S26 family peptidase n=1 Tax=unclassified Actinoplanes TaxID=2626549 RepID=UPI0012F80584|nr:MULTISPECIES: S24/S26 family peptidase [unclassified Actinoplanes]
MLLISVAPALLGWKPTVVVSGSMLPTIRPGDVVVAAPVPDDPRSRVKPGRVVLVDDPALPDELLMHRLMRYDTDGRMILKGDANASPDSTPVTLESLRGVPRLRVPFIGLPFLWVQQGRFVPVVAAGFLLLFLVVWQPRRPQMTRDTVPDQTSAEE